MEHQRLTALARFEPKAFSLLSKRVKNDNYAAAQHK